MKLLKRRGVPLGTGAALATILYVFGLACASSDDKSVPSAPHVLPPVAPTAPARSLETSSTIHAAVATATPTHAKKRLTKADADAMASAYDRAFVAAYNDGQANHKQWFGDASPSRDRAKFCAGLQKLFEKHLPAISMSGDAHTSASRRTEAKSFLELTSQCRTQAPLSIFGLSAPLAVANTRVSTDSLDDFNAWAEANITESWAIAQTGSAQTDLDNTVTDWERHGAPYSIFAQAEKWRIVRLAAAAGCVGAVTSNLSIIRGAATFGFMSGGPMGPLSGLADAAIMAGVICIGGGGAGAVAALLAY